MNSLTASLCHFLAVACNGDGYHRIIETHVLSKALTRARELKLIESPSDHGAKLDDRWVRLTAKGRETVSEGLCAMKEVA